MSPAERYAAYFASRISRIVAAIKAEQELEEGHQHDHLPYSDGVAAEPVEVNLGSYQYVER